MIAYAGWLAFQHDAGGRLDFTAEPRLSLSEN